jgi:hypothetical protein
LLACVFGGVFFFFFFFFFFLRSVWCFSYSHRVCVGGFFFLFCTLFNIKQAPSLTFCFAVLVFSPPLDVKSGLVEVNKTGRKLRKTKKNRAKSKKYVSLCVLFRLWWW